MIASPIPLQEKISELEQRIVRLEEQNKWLCRSREASVMGKGAFGKHWRKMWEEFHLAVKEMFE